MAAVAMAAVAMAAVAIEPPPQREEFGSNAIHAVGTALTQATRRLAVATDLVMVDTTDTGHDVRACWLRAEDVKRGR
jgi:hypothetical protein